MDAGQVAFAAVIASVVGPLFLAGLTNRNRRRERFEDYRRQDEVAAAALKVAESIEARQREQDEKLKAAAVNLEVYQRERTASEQETAQVLLTANERVRMETARSYASTQAQLQQIHLLVNSELSIAQRRELDATVSMLAAMREVAALRTQKGMPPTPDTLAALAAVQSRIDVLTAAVEHKEALGRLADLERAAADERIARQFPPHEEDPGQ